MSYQTLVETANQLDASGIRLFEISKDGLFHSNRRAPQMTIDITGDRCIPNAGDVLLRVYCDRGSVSLYWPYSRFDEEGNEAPLFVGSHIEVFHDGLPLANGLYTKATYTKSDPDAKVWATYEILSDAQRKMLYIWREPVDENKGLKMRYGEETYQIVGRLDPGHSVNTILRVKQH
jgi:hypothetical protein